MKKNTVKTLLIGIACLMLTSCATTLHLNITRPSELDMNGAKTIAILHFKPSKVYKRKGAPQRGFKVAIKEFFDFYNDVSADESLCTDYLERKIKENLLTSDYLTLVDSNAVMDSIKFNRDENPADVYLTGEVVHFEVNDERNEYTKKSGTNSDGSVNYIHVTEFVRHVWFEFYYQIVDSKTNEIISFEHVDLRDSSGIYNAPHELPDAFTIIKYDIEREAGRIMKKIQPYEVSKTIRLIDEGEKRDDLKAAHQLAKNELYEDAYNAFKKIYDNEKIFEAGYNAALLNEAMGNLYDAKNLMKEVYDLYPVNRAAKALSDIEYEISQAERLQNQLDAQEKQTENADSAEEE